MATTKRVTEAQASARQAIEPGITEPVAQPLDSSLLVASTSGIVKIKGRVYRYIQGQTKVRADHPLVKTMPDRFVPWDPTPLES